MAGLPFHAGPGVDARESFCSGADDVDSGRLIAFGGISPPRSMLKERWEDEEGRDKFGRLERRAGDPCPGKEVVKESLNHLTRKNVVSYPNSEGVNRQAGRQVLNQYLPTLAGV